MRFQQYILEEIEFNEFCNALDCYLTEGIISNIKSSIKNKLEFVKEASQSLKIGVEKLLVLFKNKVVFSFFQKIGWSLKKLFNLIKKGFGYYKMVIDAISEYISKTKVGKWTEDKLRDLDNWLSNHPKLKRIAGVAVAALLIYIWFNMAFTGDFTYDFDMRDILLALGGTLTISSIFAGKNGTKLLLLFATGIIGLSFPWPGPSHIQFVGSMLISLAIVIKQFDIINSIRKRL